MRFRFSLRLFLIAFTLLAILFGAAAHFVYRIKDQVLRHHQAIAKLKSKGIEFETHPLAEQEIEDQTFYRQFVRTHIDDGAYPYVGQVMLDFTPGRLMHIRPTEALEYLREVQGVKELVLVERHITREIAEQIARLPDLNSLQLYFDSMDVEAATVIGHLHELEELHLQGRVSAVDLQMRGGIDDEAFRAIASHSRLTALDVYASGLTDAGLSCIGKMQNLKTLKVVYAKQLPSELCSDLAKLPNLEELAIAAGPSLESQQLRRLLACKKLSSLRLPQTTISESDLRAFDDHPTLTEFSFVGDLSQESIKLFLRKKKRRVIRQHASPNSGAGLFYTMQDDDLYTHDLSSAF